MDVAGDNQLDISDSFLKQRLTSSGQKILGAKVEKLNEVEVEPEDPHAHPQRPTPISLS